jgi:hypothetical protein
MTGITHTCKIAHPKLHMCNWFFQSCKSKSLTESKVGQHRSHCKSKSSAVDVGQHRSHDHIYCLHPTVMIVNQDIDLLHALKSTRDAGDALETLHQLTMLQQWSGGTMSHGAAGDALETLHQLTMLQQWSGGTMSHGAHRELTEILRPYLQRKEFNSRSTEPIAVEHIKWKGGKRAKSPKKTRKKKNTAKHKIEVVDSEDDSDYEEEATVAKSSARRGRSHKRMNYAEEEVGNDDEDDEEKKGDVGCMSVWQASVEIFDSDQ